MNPRALSLLSAGLLIKKIVDCRNTTPIMCAAHAVRALSHTVQKLPLRRIYNVCQQVLNIWNFVVILSVSIFFRLNHRDGEKGEN